MQRPAFTTAYVDELRRREKELGIEPDAEVDALLKAEAVQGKRSNIVTDLMLRVLGLEVCADTIVGNQMLRGVSGGQRKRVTTGEVRAVVQRVDCAVPVHAVPCLARHC